MSWECCLSLHSSQARYLCLLPAVGGGNTCTEHTHNQLTSPPAKGQGQGRASLKLRTQRQPDGCSREPKPCPPGGTAGLIGGKRGPAFPLSQKTLFVPFSSEQHLAQDTRPLHGPRRLTCFWADVEFLVAKSLPAVLQPPSLSLGRSARRHFPGSLGATACGWSWPMTRGWKCVCHLHEGPTKLPAQPSACPPVCGWGAMPGARTAERQHPGPCLAVEPSSPTRLRTCMSGGINPCCAQPRGRGHLSEATSPQLMHQF